MMKEAQGPKGTWNRLRREKTIAWRAEDGVNAKGQREARVKRRKSEERRKRAEGKEK